MAKGLDVEALREQLQRLHVLALSVQGYPAHNKTPPHSESSVSSASTSGRTPRPLSLLEKINYELHTVMYVNCAQEKQLSYL